MRVFGIVGWSGSGKTTLLVKLLPILTNRGLRVSTIKHAHHAFDIDTPGKDSYRHRAAGAVEVLVASPSRWVLLHESRNEAEPALEDLVARMSPVDLVLVEGFKRHSHPKIEVFRAVNGAPMLHPGDRDILAVASDGPIPEATIPVLDLDAPHLIADFIQGCCGLR